MPGKLYEYAVLRLVPRVEREEFINVGVIVFVKELRWLKMQYRLDLERIGALWPWLETDLIEAQLKSFDCICRASSDSGPIGRLDVPSRFRWLTAVRSTMVQCSKVHPGLTNDPDISLSTLFDQLVDTNKGKP